MSDNNETEPTERKGPGDCLTPTATIALLLLAIVAWIGHWVLA